MIKKYFFQRLDRLIQEINHLEQVKDSSHHKINCRNILQVYGATLYYDFIFHILLLTAHIYLSVAVVINSMKTKTISSDPPWWSLGYILLATHHYLRQRFSSLDIASFGGDGF